MDAELAALAGTAGTTLVSALTTDGWQRLKEGVVALWRRARPERADSVAEQLDTTRLDLLETEGDTESTAELAAEWSARMRRLLRAHPELSADVRALVEEFQPSDEAQATVVQRATASGQSRVYQAGRDLHLGQQ